MRERLCRFCDQPMQVEFEDAAPIGFRCVPCGHQEPKDLEPPDPPGFEGGFAWNH